MKRIVARVFQRPPPAQVDVVDSTGIWLGISAALAAAVLVGHKFFFRVLAKRIRRMTSEDGDEKLRVISEQMDKNHKELMQSLASITERLDKVSLKPNEDDADNEDGVVV